MELFWGKSTAFWLGLVAVFLSVCLISFISLPKVFSNAYFAYTKAEIEEVDYHPHIAFEELNQEKLAIVKDTFSEVFASNDYKKITVVLTDVPQDEKWYWVGQDNEMINHLGFSVTDEAHSLIIYVYNNTAAFNHWGWDASKVAKENEILLVKALLYLRGWDRSKIDESAPGLYLSMHEQKSQPLFEMRYDF